MKKDYAAFAIPLIRKTKKFVMIQDAFFEDNKWKFPGGKKHKVDNNVSETLIRELKQEVPQIILLTDLFLNNDFYVKYSFNKTNPHDLYFCYTEIEFRGAFEPQGREIKAIESFDIDEIKDLIKSREMVKNHIKGFDDLILSKL